MYGVLLVDKPSGPTSHDIVNAVRRAAGQRRVGHAGTLDPLASGLLVLCLGRATRLIEYLVGQPKTYLATVRLGQSTNTYDAEGDIVEERPFTLTQPQLDQALDLFRGDIEQTPPMYSAIKRDGQPLYKLARQGIEVERPPRPITIYELNLLDWQPPDLQLRLRCSSGTYVRSLAHDLGEALGCGGHLVGLRRTAIGSLNVAQAVPLDKLSPETVADELLPPETAVAHLPRLDLTAEEVTDLRYGRQIPRQPAQPDAPLVRAHDATGALVGVVTHRVGCWQPRKILAD